MTEPIKHLLHPVTCELLDGDDLPRLMTAESETAEYLGPIFRNRAILRERVAELQGPAELPPRRVQTTKQEQIFMCPRCGYRQKEQEVA